MIVNKEKQKENKIQDGEIFLYKPYDISSKLSSIKNLKPTFVQDKVNHLKKHMKLLQTLVKTMPFHSPLHYKSLQPNGE